MNVEKYIKRQIMFAIVFLVIGVIGLGALVVLLILGNTDGNILGALGGLTFGFLPMGIGFLVSILKTKRNPEAIKRTIKQMELKNDERNLFLRTKSGNAAFEFSLWLIMGLWFLSIWVNISSRWLFPILLGTMSIIYFISIGINARKY